MNKVFLSVAALAASTPLWSQSAASFEKAAAEAGVKLEAALDELDGIQQEINTERPNLAAKLDDVESQALSLRVDASNAARLKAGYDVEVSQLNTEMKSVDDNNRYIKSTLLNEYIRRFELTIDPAELPLYSAQIKAALEFTESETNVPVEDVFRQQLEVLNLALDRVETVIGGASFEGTAIVNGTLTNGTFTLLGPVSYFSGGETGGITNGMLDNRANIYPLENFAAAISTVAQSGSGTLPFDMTDGEALEGIKHTITLGEELALGGFVMYPIIGLFALAILISLYKAVTLFGVKPAKASDIDQLLSLLNSGKQDEAIAYAKKVGGPVGQMLTVAAENANEDREVIEEMLYESIIKAQPKLESMLPFIAVVAATAPLLGLLGTVTGMIKTFKLITIVGTGDARNLSSGISEALITTKWGLIVAIPTLILHAMLNRKAKGVVGSMEQAAVSFINGMTETRESNAQ